MGRNNIWCFFVGRCLLFSIIKKFINSIPMPRLMSFFISREGKINPTWEEIKKQAPKENWERLGLQKRWKYFAIVLIMYLLRFVNDFSSYLVEILYRVDIYFYEGDGSPLGIYYKGLSTVYIINNSLYFVGFSLILYLGYSVWKQE